MCGSESVGVNGDPMRARLQSDKSADSEKSVTASQIFARADFKNENATCNRIGAKHIISAVFNLKTN